MVTKYRAQRVTIDGISFASKKEAARYCQLCLLQKLKLISNLTLQPKFPFIINGTKVCSYIADFKYIDNNGVEVVEDVKGYRTPVYKLKKKLLLALYKGINFKEI